MSYLLITGLLWAIHLGESHDQLHAQLHAGQCGRGFVERDIVHDAPSAESNIQTGDQVERFRTVDALSMRNDDATSSRGDR